MSFVYLQGRQDLSDGTVDWLTDTIKIALLKPSYTPDETGDQYFDDVSGDEVDDGDYVAGGLTLGGKAVNQDTANNRVEYDANDVSGWNAGTFTNARYAVVYYSSGVAATSTLIALIDLGSAQDAPITIQFDSEGIFAWSKSLLQPGLSHNLIKNYPSLELADGATPDWWSQGASATFTEEDATGEGIDPAPNERVLKLVTAAVNAGFSQTFIPANERLLNASSSIVSFGCWAYNSTAGDMKIILRDTTTGAISQTALSTTGVWTWIELTGVTLGANNFQLLIAHGASGATCYIANPVLNLGNSVVPFASRGLLYFDKDPTATVLAPTDPGGAGWTDIDCSGATTPNTEKVTCRMGYYNNTTLGVNVRVRRNGSSSDGNGNEVIKNIVTGTDHAISEFDTLVDDSQIFEYKSNAAAGDNESVRVYLVGYWEWE